ncbi:hypothetical protein G5V58_04845 [Nocardioides anomalus]|uniref:Uncharacterized protein n=1 Tax=Nocardioides anomalus TaxID=2712223 RepID=A0A6G6WAE5_9ACTN|nr:hypothetical protein [Nocardioides anomalus]QIG42179.1 hypothetical protein G5V58_04845 [Nocardioides anomalus]
MTDTELGRLLRGLPDELGPAAADRLLSEAMADGARRRRGRRLLVAAGTAGSAAAVVAVAVAVTGLTAPRAAVDPAPAVATSAPAVPVPTATPTHYAEGSATEVPGGPVIATDRSVVDDASLRAALLDLLPADRVADLEVAHTWSSDPTHMADTTRNGRALTFSFAGGGASVTIQRWDGYAAVGIASPGDGLASSLDGDLEQRVALTAREACQGAYRAFPPLDCTQDPGGWRSVSHPSQGADAPASHQELYVRLFTDDGYVITVDSYNTPGEKAGDVVADEPVLSLDASLALARSEAWFTTP